jgi:hypothetical protein
MNARPSAVDAHRKNRWERQWFPAKEHAPPITVTENKYKLSGSYE